MNRNIEFYVSGEVSGASGHYHVIGRCGEDAIRVGDVFTAVYQYPTATVENGAEWEPRRLDEQPIQLRVDAIHAYEHCLKELGTGMTGSLDLSGVGAERVYDSSVLGLSPAPNSPTATPVNSARNEN